MSDPIDRQKLLEKAMQIPVAKVVTSDKVIYRKAVFVEDIEQMPSAQTEPQWIPVSERLPENIIPVIVTWKNTRPEPYYQHIIGKHFVGVAHYKNEKWFWYSSITEDILAEYGRCDAEEFDEAIEVIAWMPLPKPPKMEGDQE